MKRCPGCETEKPKSDFAKSSKRPDGLQVYCRACKKQHDAAYYEKNREAQFQRVSKFRNERRLWISKLKQEKGCLYCPEDDPCCLDFHHRDSKEKEADIADYGCSWSKEKLIAEILKCDVVCSNCHRKLHAGRILPTRNPVAAPDS